MPKTPKAYKPYPEKNKSQWNTTTFNYHHTSWRKLRKDVLDFEPLCRKCKEKGLLVVATVVDHIDPISNGGDAWDKENLQPLCKTCHNSKSATESNQSR